MRYVVIGLMLVGGWRVAIDQGPRPTAVALPFWQLVAGSEWVYDLVFSEQSSVFYDPYITNSFLLSSNVTHGTGKPRPVGSTTLTLKAIAAAAENKVTVELNEEAKRLWFAPTITRASLVAVASGGPLSDNHPWRGLTPVPTGLIALELHGEMSFEKPTPDPWVLGQILAIVPADGKSRVEKAGWLVESIVTPVTVPAGTFTGVIHSRMPRGEEPSPFQRPTRPAPHVVESWAAPRVGLIRSIVSTPDGRVRYELRLKAHAPAR